jgi:hypothetical protein
MVATNIDNARRPRRAVSTATWRLLLKTALTWFIFKPQSRVVDSALCLKQLRVNHPGQHLQAIDNTRPRAAGEIRVLDRIDPA